MSDELKGEVLQTDERPQHLLPNVGNMYHDDIGRVLLVREVVPSDNQGREVRGVIRGSKSRHSSKSRAGNLTSTVVDIPLMDDLPYACPLAVFEKVWNGS